MRKRFVISSGTNIRLFRDTVRTATEALELVRHLMRLRRPNVTIETNEGVQLSFFQLMELAELEGRKEN
jgi:hypothetical protein